MNADRSLQVDGAIDMGTSCYTLLYQVKKKATIQLSPDQFFK